MFNKNKSKLYLIIVAGCAGSGKTIIGKSLSKTIGYMYLDKDTITRPFTEYILVNNGSYEGDRESELYKNNIRELEYEVSMDICMENLEIGNSVVISMPFIAQISDYLNLAKIINVKRLEQLGVKIKVVWIKHDIDIERDRIIKRNAKRDDYKLKHWDEYSKDTEKITIDSKYDLLEIRNEDDMDIDEEIKGIIKWIQK